MGAIVRAFDARPVVKEQVESLGAEFLEVDYREDGSGHGGYAKEMSEEYKMAQRRMILKQAKSVDIIITTALIPGKKAPILIDKETVQHMKPNSVIVDLAAEMGGNCELTKPGEKFIDPDTKVIIIGYTDLPSRMAEQSSELFAVNMGHLFEELCEIPKHPENNALNFAIELEDEIVRALAVVHQGSILWSPTLPPSGPGAQPLPQSNIGNTRVVIKSQEIKLELGDESNTHDHLTTGNTRRKSDPCMQSLILVILLVVLFLFIGAATDGNYTLLTNIFIFILSIFIGYMVIWNVSAALHTPLMSVTNAISGIIIVGCMYELNDFAIFSSYSICGLIGVLFAAINIFGGFIVTQRMLNMFKLVD